MSDFKRDFPLGLLLAACFVLGGQLADLCVRLLPQNRAEHDLIYQRLDYLERPRDVTE
jgi:hypothetical protein